MAFKSFVGQEILSSISYGLTGLGLNPPKPDGCGPYHSLLVWDMLGAPSNSLKGQFFPSYKKIKSIFFPLSEAFSLFTESLPQKLLLFSLPRRASSPLFFRYIFFNNHKRVRVSFQNPNLKAQLFIP